MDWSGLDLALQTPDTTVYVQEQGEGATIRWVDGEGRQVANAAIVVLPDRRIEWTAFWVEFEDRPSGIYSKALALQHGWFKHHDLGPSVIRRNAQDVVFYLSAGFRDRDDPTYIVQYDVDSKAWLERG